MAAASPPSEPSADRAGDELADATSVSAAAAAPDPLIPTTDAPGPAEPTAATPEHPATTADTPGPADSTAAAPEPTGRAASGTEPTDPSTAESDPPGTTAVTPEPADSGAGGSGPASPFPRFVVVAVVGLAVALIAGAVAVALATSGDDDGVPAGPDASVPLALAEIPAVAADSPMCARLITAMPAALSSGTTQLDRRPLADPAPAGAAAWGVDDPTVLRCGLDRPAELTQTAELLQIDGVRWLRLPDPDLPRSTYVAVDRPVYVALTLSNDSGTGPLQGVSRVIAETLPEQQVDPVR